MGHSDTDYGDSKVRKWWQWPRVQRGNTHFGASTVENKISKKWWFWAEQMWQNRIVYRRHRFKRSDCRKEKFVFGENTNPIEPVSHEHRTMDMRHTSGMGAGVAFLVGVRDQRGSSLYAIRVLSVRDRGTVWKQRRNISVGKTEKTPPALGASSGQVTQHWAAWAEQVTRSEPVPSGPQPGPTVPRGWTPTETTSPLQNESQGRRSLPWICRMKQRPRSPPRQEAGL